MRCAIACLMKRRVALFWVFCSLATLSVAVSGTLTATWDANTESDLAGYKVYYGPGTKNYTTIKDVGNQTVFVADNLPSGEEYFFAVSAYDRFGNESELSTEVSAVVPDSSLMAEAEYMNGDVQLTWDTIYSADSYDIYKSSDPYQYTNKVQTVNENSYTNAGVSLALNAGIYYKVVALSNGQPVHEFNPVGVFKLGLKRGVQLVSLPLVPPERSLTAIIGSQLTGGTNSSQSDIIIFEHTGETQSAWLAEGSGTQYDGKWMEGSGSAEFSQDIDSEISFYIKILNDHSDTVVTITGSVPMEPEKTFNLTKGDNHVGTCYPVTIPLSETDIAQDGVVTGGTNTGEVDWIVYWDDGGYKFAWLAEGSGTEYDGQWMDDSGNQISTIQFEPGRGFIIHIKTDPTNNSWTYPNPGL